MASPRTTSRVNAGRSPAAIVLIGLLGLAGLAWLLWPKPAVVEALDPSAAGSQWQRRPQEAVLSGPTMGTRFTLVLADDGGSSSDALTQLQVEVDAELAAVNAEMSTYLPDSELSRFNAEAEVGQPVAASPHLFEVLTLAAEVSEQSGGAFDVTVGPLVDAWGFGPDPRARREPSAAELAELRAVVGHAGLELDPGRQSVTKARPGLRVDLSAIAKGHGCDRVADRVRAAGYVNFMVEIGGEVRTMGHNPEGEAWRVGVERPTGDAEGARAVEAILRVRDVAVATSGDYRNYWEQDGVRYSHTIDPRTGRPITHTLASVTVIHPDSAALADAWATAFGVLGPVEGPALADELGIAAYFLVRTPGGYEVRSSPAFDPYL